MSSTRHRPPGPESAYARAECRMPGGRRGTPACDDDTTHSRPGRQARQAPALGGVPDVCGGAPTIFGTHAYRYMPVRHSIQSPLRKVSGAKGKRHCCLPTCVLQSESESSPDSLSRYALPAPAVTGGRS